VTVAPGSYVATIKTFDAIDRGGNELSLGEGLPVTVTAGQANNLPLTIGGIPRSLAILGSTVALRGNQSAGFVLYTGATRIRRLGKRLGDPSEAGSGRAGRVGGHPAGNQRLDRDAED
jgi:hypothetical protein